MDVSVCTADPGFHGGSVVKDPPASVEDVGSIPGSGRYSREGKSNPLQYSRLGNHMGKGAWWAIVLGVAKRKTRLSS